MQSDDIEFRLGTSWLLDVTCQGNDCGPLDLAGGNVRFRLAKDGVILVDLSTDDTPAQVQLAGAEAEGRVLITVKPSDQAVLDAGVYDYAVQVEFDSGVTVSGQLAGTINATPSLF